MKHYVEERTPQGCEVGVIDRDAPGGGYPLNLRVDLRTYSPLKSLLTSLQFQTEKRQQAARQFLATGSKAVFSDRHLPLALLRQTGRQS